MLVVCPPPPHTNAVEFSLRWALITVIVASSLLPTRITLAGKFIPKVFSPGRRTWRVITALGIRHWNVTLLPSVTTMGTSWGFWVRVRITWPVKRQRQMQINSKHTHEVLHTHTLTHTHTHILCENMLSLMEHSNYWWPHREKSHHHTLQLHTQTYSM